MVKMAQFEITAPNGEVYEIDAPEGTSEDQLFEYVEHQLHGGLSKDVDTGSPHLEMALQGATFGHSDEIQAGMGAAWDKIASMGDADFETRYNLRRDAIRKVIEKQSKDNPRTSLALQLGGGLLTGGAALKGAQALGTPVQGLRGAAATGATLGSVTGAGVAEEMEDIPAETAKGAVMGAVMATVLALGGTAVPMIWSKLAPGVQNRFAKLAQASGLTADDIQTRLQALGPKATIADVDDVFARAADVAASRLGPQSKNVAALLRRDETQFSRLMEPIKRTLGGQEQAIQTAGQLKQLRMDQSSPLYEQAFAKGINITSKLKDLLSRPESVKAWKKVQQVGKSDPDVDVALMGKGEPSLRGMQEITEHLADRASALVHQRKNKQARIIGNLRRAILRELDDQSPQFRQARDLWSGTKAADDALESGQNLFKMPVDDLREFLKNASEADKTFFRLGVGRAIEDKLAAATDTADLSRMLRNPAFRQKISAVMPNTGATVDLLNTIRAEAIKKHTANTVGRGSQTHPRQVAEKQLGGQQSIAADMSKEGMARRLLTALTGPREATVQTLGNKLMTTNTNEQRALLEALRRKPSVDLGAFGAGLTAGGLSSALR